MPVRRLALALLLAVAASAQTYASHPRLWLSSQMMTDLLSKKTANDADWLTVLSTASTLKAQAPPIVTITAATNASPTVFTAAATLPWASGVLQCFIGGLTGSWAAMNALSNTSVACTRVDATHFSVVMDSTSFGALTGSGVVFMRGSTLSAGYYTYEFEGGGWYNVGAYLGVVYQVCLAAGDCAGGAAQYGTAGLAFLDYANSLGAVGITGPESVDDGFPSRFAAVGVALAYDWFYGLLSQPQKDATAVTLNLWYDWMHAHAFNRVGTSLPGSNYWGGHVLGYGLVGYATVGDNARGQEIIDAVKADFDASMVPCFAQGPPAGTCSGGSPSESWNYGPGHYARLIEYMLARKTAAGDDLFASTDWLQRIGQRAIYDIHPDFWSATVTGDMPGLSSVWRPEHVLPLTSILPASTEAGWTQYLYQHLATPGNGSGGSGLNQQKVTDISKLLFYRSSVAAVDYTATQPTAKVFTGDGAMVYRSDWTSAAQYAMALLQPRSQRGIAVHPGKLAGHVDLWRGADYLLINSQQWQGTTGTVGSPYNFTAQSKYANVLYYDDQGQYFYTGAGNSGQQGIGYVAVDPTYKVASTYAYEQNDLSSSGGAYDRAVDDGPDPANRTVQYWYRTFAAMGDGTYFVLDRVKSLAATGVAHVRELRWHLNSANAPVVASGVISSVVGSSKLFIAPLGMTTPAITASDRDIATSDGSSNTTYLAKVNDTNSTTDLEVLTVMYATGSGGSLPATTLLSSSVNAYVAQVADTTPKVFAHATTVTGGAGVFTSPGQHVMTFISTHSGTGSYLVGGLLATAYTVTVDGAPVAGSPFVAGSDGTISFSSTAGSMLVTDSPALVVSPNPLSYTCVTPTILVGSQTVAVSGANVTLTNWATSHLQSWLTIAGGYGTADGSFTAAVDCHGLSVGTYTDTITVSTTTPGIVNSPVIVPVTLNVQLPTPGMGVLIRGTARGLRIGR